jgi:hypothetical protein
LVEWQNRKVKVLTTNIIVLMEKKKKSVVKTEAYVPPQAK